MTTFNNIVSVVCLVTLGWLVHELNDIQDHKQAVRETHTQVVACDAAFINLSQEQITTLETCNTDTECYALAVSLGVPPECAE
jgi:hypothetical protein